MNTTEIINELEAIRAHSLLTAEWASKLIEKIEDPKPQRKQSGLTEEKKARLEQRRMSTILKSFNG